MSIPALEFDSVEHRYGDVVALRGIDLTVAAGEVVCLLGPSGCGKTTALRLAAGLEPPAAGRVLIDGRLVADAGAQLAPEARGIGLVFQDHALFPHRTVAQNVEFGLRMQGGEPTERARLTQQALEWVGLADFGDRHIEGLSGGEQQRVALARALAPRPKLILADEPTGNLDGETGEMIIDLMFAAHARDDTTLLLVTHEERLAEHCARRVAINDGRIVDDRRKARAAE